MMRKFNKFKPKFEKNDSSRDSSKRAPRIERESRRQEDGSSFRSEKSFSKFSGGRFNNRDSGNFGGRSSQRSFSRGSSSDREMFSAECDRCGKECQLPFKPTNSKPVYCSDCFRKNENMAPRKDFSKPSKPAVTSADIEEINMKLDKILHALNLDN